MTVSQITRSRGVALFAVLAALILTVSSLVTLAQLAATTKLQAQFDARTSAANDLLKAAEAPILHWLKTTSAKVVLPADAKVPGLNILHDQLLGGDKKIVLRIQAFDQCGMAPIKIAQSGSPLRLALAQDVLSALDELRLEPDEKPGLDLFVEPASGGNHVRAFPTVADDNPVQYGADSMPDHEPSAPSMVEERETPPSIGSSIATHNPGFINVNTAPIDLVEAAMRSAGMGGLEQVIQARSEGKLASAPSPSARFGPPDNARLGLVSASPAWSFRIDIEIGSLHRSWWAVYIRESSKWECVQRLAISE